MNLEDWKSGGDTFRYGEHDIFYRTADSGKELLLCVHGFPTSSFDYKKVWGKLVPHFSLLAFDMIGYGLSAKPQRFAYRTFDQVDILEALVASLDVKRVHILSHDYGNTIVQELLARQQEGRLGFSIETVCFMNGALFPETHRPILAQKLLIGPLGPVVSRLIPDSAMGKSLASVFGPNTQPTKSEVADLITLFKNNNGKRVGHRLIQYMRERTVYRARWVGSLQRMTQPFLLVNGSDDPVSGKHLVDRFRELVPGQTNIVELPGVGHFPQLEVPEAFMANYLQFRGINVT